MDSDPVGFSSNIQKNKEPILQFRGKRKLNLKSNLIITHCTICPTTWAQRDLSLCVINLTWGLEQLLSDAAEQHVPQFEIIKQVTSTCQSKDRGVNVTSQDRNKNEHEVQVDYESQRRINTKRPSTFLQRLRYFNSITTVLYTTLDCIYKVSSSFSSRSPYSESLV